MELDIVAVQEALQADSLDGWLLYDFHGSNPIASHLIGLDRPELVSTRRWFYFLPASGEPRILAHAIELHHFDDLPGVKESYTDRQQLKTSLQRLLTGQQRIAMEYSPKCSIPSVSRVDAGTIELIRELGLEVVSSGNLVQKFEATWNDLSLDTHRNASEILHRIKDRTFAEIANRIRESAPVSEYEIRNLMLSWFKQERLITDAGPIVATQENTASPHYQPTAERHRTIEPEQVILIDLWGKLPIPGAVFADITWMGYTGRKVPDDVSHAFETVCNARDVAISLVQSTVKEGRELRGWEVDRTVRDIVERAGYGSAFVHRTGHSLGVEVHGTGVNMDDYETHDDRLLLPGTGFTIEPGIYLDSFGVRTEINMYISNREGIVTGPTQTEILALPL